MGMTIDKIIKRLLWFEDYNEENYCGGDRIQDEYGEWFYKVTEEDFEAFRQAAETMRKYQKIEQIVSDFKEYQKGISCGFGGEVYMQMVSEVVEDGNNG